MENLLTQSVATSGRRISRQYLFLFLFLLVLPFVLEMGASATFCGVNKITPTIPSANKMAATSYDQCKVAFYLSLVFIVSLPFSLWHFFAMSNLNDIYLLEIHLEKPRGYLYLLIKSIISAGVFGVLVWYLYELPGGIDTTKPGRVLTTLRLALNYQVVLGFLGGILSMGISALCFFIMLRMYYISRILFFRD